jgi:hypothetical protein
MGINLPAVLLWIPLELGAFAFSRLFGVSSDIPSAVAFGLAVFGFWLWVGVRLERAFIFQRTRGTSTATGRIVVLILCSLLLVTSVAVFLLFRDAYLIEMKLPMVDWLIVGVWVALRRLLRSAPRSSTSDQVGDDRQM